MSRSIPWVLSEIVAPALQQVLPDDPMARLQLIRCRSPYAGRDATPDAIQVEIDVSGEGFVYTAYDPVTFSTADDARERLVSELADFVAESRFGWGQLRA